MANKKHNGSVLMHTCKMVFVAFWIALFSYPAAWHLTTTDREFRRFNFWRKTVWAIDDKVYPFADLLHLVFYPVHNAAFKGKADRIARLTPDSSTFNSLDAFHQTPLAYAALFGESELVETMLKAGADPNTILAEGSTALHHAMQNSEEKAAMLLLAGNARVDAPDKKGTTPLHLAVQNNLKAAFTLALKPQQHLSIKDSAGLTPLDYAISRNSYEMVTALANAGAEPVFSKASPDMRITIFLAQWQKTGNCEAAMALVETSLEKYSQTGYGQDLPAELPVDNKKP